MDAGAEYQASRKSGTRRAWARSDVPCRAEHPLSPEAHELFLDTVEAEYLAAIALLKRRSEGDFSADKRPLRFPKFATEPS